VRHTQRLVTREHPQRISNIGPLHNPPPTRDELVVAMHDVAVHLDAAQRFSWRV
jgi:hypothetical protein